METQRQHRLVSTLKDDFAAGRIDRREFLRSATLLGLSVGAAYGFVSHVTGESVIQAARADDMPRGGRLRLGMRVQATNTPHTVDTNEESNILRQVCEYLTITGQDNITRPYLAEGWEVSDDLRTWTFRIRQGVKWHSGREFTADDAVWNILHVLDDNTGSSVQGLMAAYMLEDYDTGEVNAEGAPIIGKRLWKDDAVEKVDDYTLRLNCKEPQLAVPEHFFHYPFLMLDPAENGFFGPGSNGTGPFELVEATRSEKAVLKARPDYWSDGPYLDTLEIIDLGIDPAAAIGAIASGQVDGLFLTTSDQIGALEALPDLEFYSVVTAETLVCRGKCTEAPFNDPRVRKALRLATDQQIVVDAALQGHGLVGEHHHVSPIHPEYAELPKFERDIAAAKQLLDEAGYPDGLELEFTYSDSRPYYSLVAQVYQQQWKDAGINITLNSIPADLYWEVWDKLPLGLTPWYHRPLGVMTLGLAYRSGAPWNESSYSNPEFDRLLTMAEGIVDAGERSKVMAEIETIMQEDGPIVQPFWIPLSTFFHSRVKGFRMHPSGYIFANELAVEA